MKISVKLTVICTLHWFYFTLGQKAKVISQCAAPPAELTKEATVTCVFPADEKTDFDVYHQKEKVADCIWVSSRPDCTLKPGYDQDDQMDTNSFTLRIPYFLQNHTGRYSCVLDGYDTKECSLSKRTISSSTPGASSNRNVTRNDEKSPKNVLIIAVSILSAYLVVTIAAVVIYSVYKRSKKNARKQDNVPTVETGGDAKESCDIPLVERKPTPESTAGQQTDASIRLLNETGDTSTLQQEQIDRYNQTCINVEQSGTHAERSKCLERQLNQEKMQVLSKEPGEKATRNYVTSKLSEEAMFYHSTESTDDCITSANTQVIVRYCQPLTA